MKHILVVTCALLIGLMAACTSGGGSSGPPSGPCTDGQIQCEGRELQTCSGGAFATTEVCDFACSADLGRCAECDPGVGTGCDGNDVVGCSADGTLGEVISTCNDEQQCVAGVCSDECTADGVDLIYVVDDNNAIYSFDPRKITQGQAAAFTELGDLNCNAPGPAVQGWGGGVTPFSMAVDRDAVAKVLYTNGHIYNVSTTQGAVTCADSGYTPLQGGDAFRVFGMGYVSDVAGGDTETMFVSGSMHVQGLDCANSSYCGTLGSVNASNTLASIGQMPVAQQEPELTGDGNGQLWAFFPGASAASVKPIDKTNAAGGTSIDIPGGLGGTAQAWAFAHWGGKFYIFVTINTGGGGTNSKVLVLTKAGAVTTAFENLPMKLVGAGVSTCAPVVEPPIS